MALKQSPCSPIFAGCRLLSQSPGGLNGTAHEEIFGLVLQANAEFLKLNQPVVSYSLAKS
jgi:hypothetical protein